MNTTPSSTLVPAWPDSTGARRAILGALRQAAPSQGLPVPTLAPYHAGPFGRGTLADPLDSTALQAQFTAAAQGWRAEVLHATPQTWPQAVRAALDRHGARCVAFGAASPNDPGFSGVLKAEAAAGGALDGLTLRPFERPLQDWKEELFEGVDAGITAAAAGASDTGSLVLCTGPGEPRTLSLVPPLHVAVLRASRLRPSLPQAFAAVGVVGDGRQPAGPPDLPTNLLLVTGPSKTADIQQVLAFGAHGPKALVIVLVNDLGDAQPEHTA
ncbi:LutC/YkgG family protein [Ideonella livida]|uniref:Lactate utilization protein C n=1 Tax=Ideonella livida TaxID=2707176 RepID=A0A7C9TM17_9BURK|nr:lactate utilization protein C [Ideonella livida]NDY91346.1 lactate utilization protein C [Ideonella livida]